MVCKEVKLGYYLQSTFNPQQMGHISHSIMLKRHNLPKSYNHQVTSIQLSLKDTTFLRDRTSKIAIYVFEKKNNLISKRKLLKSHNPQLYSLFIFFRKYPTIQVRTMCIFVDSNDSFLTIDPYGLDLSLNAIIMGNGLHPVQ